MATKVFFLNSTLANYGEEEQNWMQKFLFEEGCLNSQGSDWEDWVLNGDLKVKQRGAGANMSVDVSIGWAIIETVRSSVTFKIFALNNAVANLVIGANGGGANRVDAVIMRIDREGEANALMNNIATLAVIAGSGASPLSNGDIQTALGDNDDFIRLADVTVVPGATSITDSDIADTRVRAVSTNVFTLGSEVIRFLGIAADPATGNLTAGDMWFNNVANTMNFYDGSSIIEINNIVYTEGDGIDITANVISVALYGTEPGLEFSGGLLKVTDDLRALGKRYLIAGESISERDVCILKEISENYNTGTDDRAVADLSANKFVSQGFQIPQSQKIFRGSLFVKKIGTPADNLRVHIYNDNAGSPGSSLGYVDIATGNVGTTYAEIEFVITAGVSLTANAQYHIVCTTSAGAVDASNYFQVESSTAGGYSYGSAKLSADGAAWSTDGTRDIRFKIFYFGAMKADNDDETLNEGGEMFVANAAVSARVQGTFIERGVKTGFDFDLYEDTVGTPYNQSGSGTASLSTGDSGDFFGQYFVNTGGYRKLVKASVWLYKDVTCDGNYTVTLRRVTGDVVLATATGANSGLTTSDSGTEIALSNIFADIYPGEVLEIRVVRTATTGTLLGAATSTGITDGVCYTYSSATYNYQNSKLKASVTAMNPIDYEVGDYVYTSATAGGYGKTGKRCVGKIIDQDTLLVGKRPTMSFIKSLGPVYMLNNSTAPSQWLRVPKNAQTIVLNFVATNISSYTGAGQIILTRSGITTGSWQTNHYTGQDRKVSATWDVANSFVTITWTMSSNVGGNEVTAYFYE